VTAARPLKSSTMIDRLLSQAAAGQLPSLREATVLQTGDGIDDLISVAGSIRDRGHGDVVSFSRKVFIPLTKLCRDVCHYCTFARPPRGGRAYLSPEEVFAIAQAGAAAGCKEALFTLGDKPELRYASARHELGELGHATTLDYLGEMAALVFDKTGLLPHLNPGVMTGSDLQKLRRVSVSQGLMLETISSRLSAQGRAHHGSPDKDPALRLRTIAAAGEVGVPMTTGLLIGIGETRAERIEALFAIRKLHEEFGHIQEIIIQNFRAKAGTRMATFEEPSFEDHLWTIAVARLIFGPMMNIQAPPNLSAGALPRLIEAGINDWGGVSPITIDHVNPEAPWPEIAKLAEETARAGKVLTERLSIYPSYALRAGHWLAPEMRAIVLTKHDAEGFAREGAFVAGAASSLAELARKSARYPRTAARKELASLLEKASEGKSLCESEIVSLFSARGDDAWRVMETADRLRRSVNGNTVSYVVTRNINYTNVCGYRCQFCAFSKGKTSENLRGKPYDLDLREISRRVVEAWERGASEVCMQGGIHPRYTGQTYLDILAAVKTAAPYVHIHAFSPLEVTQGAKTLRVSVKEFLRMLKQAGLGTLPGTAAEILDDEIRQIICPDKLTTEEWLAVMRDAHELGLRSTATIMFGHVDHPVHWARHLLRLRSLQKAGGGFTELVPLPFVPFETPIYLKGRARRGPTLRESVLMHAVSRLALHPHFMNIQTSWTKMGAEGAKLCLNAGANDLGGTLMNETISRAAGAQHGQEMPPSCMEKIIASIGRIPRQRTTLYADATPERRIASFEALKLAEIA
jgi:FO synthase